MSPVTDQGFVFEFRQRVAESVAELPGASQAAYGLEGSEALVKTLELGWVFWGAMRIGDVMRICVFLLLEILCFFPGAF